MSEFLMPSLGADMTHGTLLEWRVKPGDEVERGQIVAVVDTEKAAIEIEVFDSGIVAELLVEPGTRVPVGTPLARFQAADEPGMDHTAPADTAKSPPPERPTERASDVDSQPPAPMANLAALRDDIGSADHPDAVKRDDNGQVTGRASDHDPDAAPPVPTTSLPVRTDRADAADHRVAVKRDADDDAADHRQAEAESSATKPRVAPSARPRVSPAARTLARSAGIELESLPGSGPEGAIVLADVAGAIQRRDRAEELRDDGEPHASPLARRVADDLGVDLHELAGSGWGGTIVRDDVERAARAQLAEPAGADGSAIPAPPATAPTDREARRRAMREAIAAAVTRSKREIPHYYLASRIDLSRALAWLDATNRERAVEERILPAALLLRTVAVAARRHPAMNGFWTSGGFQPADAVHLGVAVSLRGGGLITPSIQDADSRSLPELMAALADLVRRARSGGLRGSELTSASITVTQLGDRGSDVVFGVIYPPQVAIVGFGTIREQPWAENGMLAVRPVVQATLAADHRASDGHDGSLFLDTIDRLLQEPESL